MPIILLAILIIGGLIVANHAAGISSTGEVDNNPGNLEDHVPPTAWVGRIGYIEVTVRGVKRRFVKFDTLEHGVRALMINVLTIWQAQSGYNWLTLAGLGEIWSPAADNPGASVGSYGAGLAASLKVAPNAPYDFVNGLIGVAQAIIINERGTAALATVPPATFQQAYSDALAEKGIA